MKNQKQYETKSARVAIIFLILFTLLSLLVAFSKEADDEQEYQHIDPSAMSDEGLGYELFLNLSPYVIFARYQGKPLYRRQMRFSEREDASMLRVGKDDEDQIYLYQQELSENTKNKKSAVYYLKVCDDFYVPFGKQRFFPGVSPSAEKSR